MPAEDYEGPIEVKSASGQVMCSVGENVFMVDGPPLSWNAAGTPYETLLVRYVGLTQEECEDIGMAKIFKDFSARMAEIINDEDFWSLEWRLRPTLEYNAYHDTEARIIDKETGQERQGIELKQAIDIRCRFIVHKRSARQISQMAAE